MAQTKIKLIADGVIDVNNLKAGHTITTDNIGEGANLYYTDARVGSYLSTNSYATEGYVTTAVANLVDAAPSTLDTLNELAAALGDDPNFATTVTNSIATKLPLAGGTLTGDLIVNANIGIGTTNPTQILTLDTSDLNAIAFNNSGTLKAAIGVAASTSQLVTGSAADDLVIRNSSNILFSNGPAERVRIDSSGNVGIGRTPTDILDIQGGITVQQAADIKWQNTARDTIYGAINSLASALTFKWADSEVARIDSNGNVGIGCSPNTTLHVADSGDSVLRLEDTSVSGSYGEVLYGNGNLILKADEGNVDSNSLMTFRVDGSERMRIDSSGNVIVGSTTANNANAATFRQDGTAHVNNVQLANAAGSAGGTTPSIYSPAGGQLAISLNSAERLRIDGSGNVGIGTSSPNAKVEIRTSGNTPEILRLYSDQDYANGGSWGTFGGYKTFYGRVDGSASQDYEEMVRCGFLISGSTGNPQGNYYISTRASGGAITERMRIDSDGRLRVGPESGANRTGYNTQLSDSSGNTLSIQNPNNSVGDNVSLSFWLRNSNSAAEEYGNIITQIIDASAGNEDGKMYFRVKRAGGFWTAMELLNTGVINLGNAAQAIPSTASSAVRFIPIGDGTVDLGYGNARWEEVFSVNGTINTSDANEKQQIESLNEVELKVATRIKGLIKKFKWNTAVDKKGEDARIHVGVIAQDVKAAFEAEGLDAHRYSLFTEDTWWEKEVTEVDSEGVETTKTKILEEYEEGAIERTRLGVRYTELLAFVIAAI